MTIDVDYLLATLTELLHTPSPTGDAAKGIDLCARLLCHLNPRQVHKTSKGTLLATFAGQSDSAPRGITAHVDTIGMMVRAIKSNGRLQLAQIGSFDWKLFENEGVTIQTANDGSYRGTVLFDNASYHVHL